MYPFWVIRANPAKHLSRMQITGKAMKLFVPSPGHINSLKELLKEKDKIYSIFMAGSPDYIGTGRSNLASPQLEDIAEQTEHAHKNGVKMELVLNSSCMGGRQLTPKGTGLTTGTSRSWSILVLTLS